MDQTKKEKIISWIGRCRESLNELNNASLSYNDKLTRVRSYYNMIMLINNVLDGKTKLLGVDKKIFENKQNGNNLPID